MNELSNLDHHSEELSTALNELALKFNIPPSLLREALMEEAKEFQGQKLRDNTSWIWKVQELFNGTDGVKETLFTKWSNINIVCTLLLTVTVPMGLSPPQSLYSNTDPDYIYSWFQGFMFISSTFSMMGILSNAFWIDLIETFCPRKSDIAFYVNCGTFDVPLQMMVGSIFTSIAGFVVLMKNNCTTTTFNFGLGFGVVIVAYFLFQFFKISIPLLRRHSELMKPFQNASKWVNITEDLLREEELKLQVLKAEAELLKFRNSSRLSNTRYSDVTSTGNTNINNESVNTMPNNSSTGAKRFNPLQVSRDSRPST